MNYCKNLRFEDKPDYAYLRNLFKDLFTKMGFENDYLYDWLKDKKPEKKPENGSQKEEKKVETTREVNMEAKATNNGINGGGVSGISKENNALTGTNFNPQPISLNTRNGLQEKRNSLG